MIDSPMRILPWSRLRRLNPNWDNGTTGCPAPADVEIGATATKLKSSVTSVTKKSSGFSAKAWLVSGLLRVEDLEETLDAKLAGEDYETVAGMIFTNLGRVPATGTVIPKNGYLFEIERADRRRIYRVKVRKDPNWDADAHRENGE